ncbi:MAG: pyridoxamine kinase [Ruminococcaceae bacterium]|nr:pyridoxamine kinase [Oscillospiraceae bacterium]MBQ8898679.1 pyridoxamine kinase [Clostridia bacterium]
MSHNVQKKIAVVNDFCGFGRCSLTAAMPVISALKVQCCPLPTAIFSNHTGYENFYSTDLTDHMSDYILQWKKLGLRFNGILTGFLGSTQQIEIVTRFLEDFKTEATVTVIDPVMGDGGSLYRSFSRELAEMMGRLVPYADILTPNLTEAAILTHTDYCACPTENELCRICEKLFLMGPKKIVISGLDRGDYLENFIYSAQSGHRTVRAKKTGPCRAGTGDVFSAIIAADAVNGVELTDSVSHAAEFISKALEKTVEMGLPETDGICIEELLGEL